MDLDEHSHDPGRSRLWFSILAVVLITAVAIWLVPDERQEAPEAIPVPQPKAGPPVSPPSSVQTNAPAEHRSDSEDQHPATTSQPPPQGPEGSAARAFLAGFGTSTPPPGELLARAEEFQRQGLLADAWLLRFKAARDGSAEAALILGRQADPAHFDPEGSVSDEPDLVQAWKWYSLAARQGSQEAEQAKQGILERLAAMAEQGDERAALLLQEWKKR